MRTTIQIANLGRSALTRRGGRHLYKLFTTFPEGWPALGLLLIRLTIAFSGFEQVLNAINRPDPQNAASWSVAVLSALVSAALVVGILTPLASCMAALMHLRDAAWSLFFSHQAMNGFSAEAGYIAMTSIALLLLGPGALSLDARLFGRREIIIPDNPHSSRP
jgi:uncharacterized membrane protein YphA (DoxX/SURF4 family)